MRDLRGRKTVGAVNRCKQYTQKGNAEKGKDEGKKDAKQTFRGSHNRDEERVLFLKRKRRGHQAVSRGRSRKDLLKKKGLGERKAS